MLRKFSLMGASALVLGALALGTPAQAAGAGVKVGVLTCNVSSGWGFVFGSSKDLRCTYSPNHGHYDHYNGTISKWGVDVGYTAGGVMVWAVFAPTADVAPGALEGDYGGVSASATAAVGAGANVLVGGSHDTISLQPVSVEGNTGLNVAAGVGAITLRHVPGRYR